MAFDNSWITLREYQDSPVDIPEEDVQFLIAEGFEKKIYLGRSLDGALVMNPSHYIGVLPLPSGKLLQLLPKIPLSNVFRMLAATLLQPFRTEPVDYDTIDDILRFFAEHFLNLLQALIRAGLFRSYEEQFENLQTVRGRIDFAADINRNFILRYRTFCHFSELTWNVAENQVIRQVLQLLKRYPFDAAIQTRLVEFDEYLFEAVDVGHFRADDVLRFSYHRLNFEYQPLHKLCHLFLLGCSIGESKGEHPFFSFLVDMNRLFENFIQASIRTRLRRSLIFLEGSSVSIPLDCAGKVSLQPDITIEDSNAIIAVADCKYKDVGSADFRHHDIYQMLSYCVATGLDFGTLIYPSSGLDKNSEISIVNGGPMVKLRHVNLNSTWEAVQEQLDDLSLEICQPRSRAA